MSISSRHKGLLKLIGREEMKKDNELERSRLEIRNSSLKSGWINKGRSYQKAWGEMGSFLKDLGLF